MVDIWIGDNYYAGCSEYSDYHSNEDYKTEYWKAYPVKGQKGKFERRKAFGKRVTINGRVFFTEDSPNYSEDIIRVTDGETGGYVGSISYLKENWKTFLDLVNRNKQNNFSNVLDLPTADEKAKTDAKEREGNA